MTSQEKINKEVEYTLRLVLIQKPLLSKMKIDLVGTTITSLFRVFNEIEWREDQKIAYNYGKMVGLLMSSEFIKENKNK